MAISFPTPNLSDPSTLTTTQAGITWTWNDTLQVWSTEAGSSGGGASVSVGQNPPTDKSQGDLWWADSDVDEGGGRLYVWTGDEWVDASLPGGGGASGDFLSKTENDTAAGAITFEGKSTHEAGVIVSGGRINPNTGADGGIVHGAGSLYLSSGEYGTPINTFMSLNTDSSSGTTFGSNHSVDGDVSARNMHITYGGSGHLKAFTNVLCQITENVTGDNSDKSVTGISSDLTADQATTEKVCAFKTALSKTRNSSGPAIAFLATGDAMNLFRGDLRSTQAVDAEQDDWRPGGGTTNKGFRWDTERNIGNMCGDDSVVFNVTQNSLSGRLMNFFTNGNLGVCGRIEPLTNTTCSYNAGNGGTFVNTSDYRIKTDVVDLEDAADVVKQLRPISFKYTDADKTHIGFIAHELQEHVPSAVQGTKDETQEVGTLYDPQGEVIETGIAQPKNLSVTKVVIDDNDVETQINETRSWVRTGTEPVYQGVDQSKLIPLLTKALQEVIAENEDIKSRLDALEGN